MEYAGYRVLSQHMTKGGFGFFGGVKLIMVSTFVNRLNGVSIQLYLRYMRDPLWASGASGLFKYDTCVFVGSPIGLLITRANYLNRPIGNELKALICFLCNDLGSLCIVFDKEVRTLRRGILC